MDVSCPACGSRYTADDEKLRGKTARMRCRACDTVWLVSDEKRAAVVKRGGDRDHRDLFASQPLEMGSVKQTLRPAPVVTGGGTGARNESSVLFSLEGLVRGQAAASAIGRLKTPEPEPLAVPPSVADDEGIIDLKALASAGARPAAAPLFSEPPPGAFARDAGSSSNFAPASELAARVPPHVRKIGAIAAGAVALVATIIGLTVAFRGEEPVPRTAAAAMILPPPAPVAPAAPAAAAAAASDKANATASNDDDDDDAQPPVTGVKHKSKGKHHRGKGKHKRSFTWKKGDSTRSPAPARRSTRAADPCHCKGDFNCILRCTATGK